MENCQIHQIYGENSDQNKDANLLQKQNEINDNNCVVGNFVDKIKNVQNIDRLFVGQVTIAERGQN